MEEKPIKMNRKLIISLEFLFVISLFIMLFINLTPSKKSNNPINEIFSQIKECNNDFDGLINSDGINTEKAIETLSNETDKLNSIKNSLDQIEISDDENDIKSKLLENLNYNSTLNNLCITLLKNTEAKDFASKYDDYAKTYTLLLNNYDSLTALGIDLNFNDNAKEFFNYASKYFSTLISLTRDNDIKTSQQNTYILNLKDCIEAFDKIDEDLKPALDKIREDHRDFNYLLKDIKDKKSILNQIKNQSYCITIPENGTECFNLLQDTITYYDLYITSLEHSIIIEKTSNDENNKKSIEENYENSFSKFSDFQESLKSLRTELDNFNNK